MASTHKSTHKEHYDEHPHAHHRHHHEDRPRLPDIPDLRFEYSYVRSVRRYINVERVSQPAPSHAEPEEYEALDVSSLHEKTEESKVAVRPAEVITVQWGKVLWVTLRDQVISPFVQGTIWALVAYQLSPVSAQVGSRLGTFVHQKLPSKEGLGISWLRSKVQSIGLSRSAKVQ